MRKLPDESRLAQNLDTGQSDADSAFPEKDLWFELGADTLELDSCHADRHYFRRDAKRELIMVLRALVGALAIYAAAGSVQTRAQESLVTHKSLSPAIALDAAQAALADCQQRGYQVAVAVVDRFGVVQVVLRDRYAGPHTPATASGKAWTAATFRTSTSSLVAISQPGMMQAGIRSLPGAVILGGGLVVESGGSLVGAVGVSGAPGGDADEACAKAGIEAIQGKLDF